ncbi:MAG: HIT family protein [Thermodesulfobacteriota bacterium]
MSDCLFCRIVSGQIPSTKVYEDDRFLGFMDINPVTRGHCLLIPKDHHENLFALPEDLLREYIGTARRLAGVLVKGLEAKGLNLIQSNGRAANQIIDHCHLHLIPRYAADEIPLAAWEMRPGDPQEIGAAAEAVRKAF